ncbi:GMC family oxidoreductase [Agrobacterium arsenijevicii]|uniref:Glucose dehydrogenase n=1 Tax=Agrobacterium arsenijevicii TaxID=1585697 RepID=A0ABR5CZV4_9HYPH|nr:glucose dehydrogenase [Agrobacterium arsenijevicii]
MTNESQAAVYDVVIVGAGPSGAVAAKRLAEEGMSVVCLEQGSYPDYTKLRHSGLEFELTKNQHFATNPNRRKDPSDYPIDVKDSDIEPLMWNGVGGSSVLYAAAWHRLKPSDFRVRTVDGIADDWPLSYAELEPFYARVENDFAVSGVGGDPAYPAGFDIPLPPFPMTAMDRKFSAAHDRLGWHWWPGSNSIATVKHNGLHPCVRRGACTWGCFDGAKASVDRTHWPASIKLGVKLVQNARVLRVETGSDGLATGVTYIDRESGITHFQPGRLVIVSANGIGTPRLLLNSASAQHPHGLGNSSGMVGKRLMMHPYGTVTGLFDDFFENWQGPYGQRAYSLEFAETRKDTNFYRGAKWQLMGMGGPLATVGSWPWGSGGNVWGENFHETVRKRFGRSAYWGIMAEDLPSEDNMVVLDPDVTDAQGMPAVKVKYKASQNTLDLLDYNVLRATESMKEAGAYEVSGTPLMRETGWHILGTARMGNDATTSVVDGFGRSHDVANLFVMDGSVMPTSGAVNPTGTVTALALRNAEAIIANRRSQPVSQTVEVRKVGY